MPLSLDDAVLSVLDKKTWKRSLEVFDEIRSIRRGEAMPFESLELESLCTALDSLKRDGFILKRLASFSGEEQPDEKGRSAYEYRLAGERLEKAA